MKTPQNIFLSSPDDIVSYHIHGLPHQLFYFLEGINAYTYSNILTTAFLPDYASDLIIFTTTTTMKDREDWQTGKTKKREDVKEQTK